MEVSTKSGRFHCHYICNNAMSLHSKFQQPPVQDLPPSLNFCCLVSAINCFGLDTDLELEHQDAATPPEDPTADASTRPQSPQAPACLSSPPPSPKLGPELFIPAATLDFPQPELETAPLQQQMLPPCDAIPSPQLDADESVNAMHPVDSSDKRVAPICAQDDSPAKGGRDAPSPQEEAAFPEVIPEQGTM